MQTTQIDRNLSVSEEYSLKLNLKKIEIIIAIKKKNLNLQFQVEDRILYNIMNVNFSKES